jgi:hypothetical protein
VNTLVGLHQAVRGRLATMAAALSPLETKSGGTAQPAIYDGWVPPKPGSSDGVSSEQFPFLILRPREGSDTPPSADQNARATIDILIGIYNDTQDGWLDLLPVIDAIRAEFWDEPVIENTGYEHDGPLTWAIPPVQARPQWLATVTTIWIIPRPRRVEARDPLNPEEV